jgi:hypothetical protein
MGLLICAEPACHSKSSGLPSEMSVESRHEIAVRQKSGSIANSTPCSKMEEIMHASTLSFRSAVCFGIAGMIAGIVMAAVNDHSFMPAHAHLNLLGWVSLFLFGIFYHLHPALDASRTALVQVAIWIVATIILTCGFAAIYLGHLEFAPVAITGSLIILGDMLLFAFLVFRPERSAIRTMRAAAPAE